MILQRVTEKVDAEDGTYICYQTADGLFNLRFYKHTMGQLISELLFVDLVASTAITTCFARAA